MPLPALPLSRADLSAMGLRGIHCGSGRTLHAQLLNMDAMRLQDGGQSSAPGRVCCFRESLYYLEHDQTTPLPLEDGSVEWVFSEHFIEHIQVPQAVSWFAELHRVMQPGGIARISTPDLALYARGYADPQQAFYNAHRQRLREMGMTNPPLGKAWMMNQIFRHYGHQWLYDYDEIVSIAAHAGFSPAAIRRVSFAEGSVQELARLDQVIRNDESLYVELRR